MSTTCPNGHSSATTDYCDQCGVRLADLPSPEVAGSEPQSQTQTVPDPADVEVSPDTKPSLPAEPCPDCGAPRVGSDKFCEGCGYNFATRKPSEDRTSSPALTPSQPPTAELWEALVSADREYFERVAVKEIGFPSHCPPRRFALEQPEIGIGRHSPSRGIRPEIDLSGAPEDPAISHLHAILIRQDNGSYSLVDPGSTNGITLNDESTPIAANTPMPLSDGDRIHLGAWTTITIRHATTSPAADA
jgi:hypothetical protein